MRFIPWAIALLASTGAGALACGALVARRRVIVAYLAGTGLTMVVTVMAWGTVWSEAHRPDTVIAVAAISLGTFVGGYALGASLLGSVTSRAPATLTLLPGSGAVTGGVHVVLLSDEEPKEYDPAAVTAGLARYEDGDVDLPPEVARPLVYASERSRYHVAGGSPARGVVRAVAASLETVMKADDEADDVTVAFCVGEPSLASAVSGIIARGGRRIVVAPLAPAWSPAFSEAMHTVPLPTVVAAGASLETARPLWSSQHVSAMIAQRAVSTLGGDRSTDGIVLLSEGDPWEHTKDHEEYREQMTFLIQRVRAELVQAGVSANRIKRAWLWLEEPDVAESIRHLVAVGARNIALVPVTFPTETISTLTDVRYAAEQAAADTGASVNVIAPWGNDPAVVEALKESVEATLDEPDESDESERA
jgi:protoheme ferro-lyase